MMAKRKHLPDEQENLKLLEAAIDDFMQNLHDNEQLKFQANTVLDLYEERVLIFKRRCTDMIVAVRYVEEKGAFFQKTIHDQAVLIEKQTRRIQQLISLLHIPKDVEPVFQTPSGITHQIDETKIVEAEQYTEEDAFSDAVKKLQQIQDATHDGIDYHDEGI
jgi:hypothetical protein